MNNSVGVYARKCGDKMILDLVFMEVFKVNCIIKVSGIGSS